MIPFHSSTFVMDNLRDDGDPEKREDQLLLEAMKWTKGMLHTAHPFRAGEEEKGGKMGSEHI